ncbi:MAG: 6-pyruvoyl trahydropterin synthase family protein [Planctomycetota bacterium]
MFKVSVETCFWASHQLTLPDGSKEARHSHNWLVAVDVSSSEVNGMGLVMDFRRLKTAVDKIVADFDNMALEKLAFFERNNASAENVSKYIYEKLEPALAEGLKLNGVRVTEQAGCTAEFGKY